ncbi:NAD(P)-binding protein [Trichocladium antarcticum]|uniref:NAD(P)-binding protein n=1 Tax=Trichocladium antarcticum TaxID=1450529 RepID=A0AAN6UF89_9PEZI|nr:NAD(P)-binding protein [Trichocladium antarcticum]
MPYSLTVKKTDGKPGQVYYPLQLNTIPIPTPGPGQLLVRLSAAALNHRDLFIRQALYPGISFTAPLLADGYGIVTALGHPASASPRAQSLLRQPVLLTPSRGWDSDPAGPEDLGRAFTVVGASRLSADGTAQEWIVVDEDEVVAAPAHLTAAEGAALPLVGVTGWRALVTKAGVRAGDNVLVTGIGGGVALQVLQFAVAMGVRVWVTSGDAGKIARAKGLGAEGGVCYKDRDWDRQLGGMLPAERPYLDAVVDGAGGDVVGRTVKLLKPGGVISSYGMTVGPRMDWLMQAALKQVELKGTTMGSKAEFRAMVDFVRAHKIRPVVSRVVKGLDNIAGIEGLFDDMKAGRQFGKLVIQIDTDADSAPKL